MRRDPEPGLAADGTDRALELFVVKWDEAAAVAAEKVMVMLAAGAEPLVAGGAAAEIQPLEETQPLELLQRPVDAGPADFGQAAVDLRGGQRTGLARQERDNALAGGPTAPA